MVTGIVICGNETTCGADELLLYFHKLLFHAHELVLSFQYTEGITNIRSESRTYGGNHEHTEGITNILRESRTY